MSDCTTKGDLGQLTYAERAYISLTFMPFNTFVERKARVTVKVKRPDKSGQLVDQKFVFEQHRMTMSLKDAGAQFGVATVQVFGVPLSTMNLVGRLWNDASTPSNADTLEIDIWDGRAYIALFQGTVTWSACDLAGLPNVALNIEASAAFIMQNNLASPYASGTGPVRLSAALTAIVKPVGITVDYSPSATDYQLTDVHVAGSPMEQVNALMRHYQNLTYQVHLQRLYVRRADASFNDDPVRIAMDTGMQRLPTYSRSGIQLSLLHDPRVRPGAALDVYVQGVDFINDTRWSAAVVQHDLQVNTPGGVWTTSVAAISFGSKKPVSS